MTLALILTAVGIVIGGAWIAGTRMVRKDDER